MNPPTMEQARSVHETYTKLSGVNVPFTMELFFRYEAFLAFGFTEADLVAVIKYTKSRINKGRLGKESLLLRNLIRDQTTFSENLAIARQEHRDYVRSGNQAKKSVLAATGRKFEPNVEAVKSASDIVPKLIADLRAAVQ